MEKSSQYQSQKAKKAIIEYILNEQLEPHEALPGELVLMELFSMSRYAVREALTILEQEKIIYKVRGKGTFVNRRPFKMESGLERLESITTTISKASLTPGTRWIGIEFLDADKEVRKNLMLEENEKVVTFKRMRLADDRFAAYCVDTIPFKYLQEVPTSIEEESMFTFLGEKYGIHIESSTTSIEPARPTFEMLDKLQVEDSMLLTLLTQIHYDRNRTPIIYSLDYFNPNVIKFNINRVRS